MKVSLGIEQFDNEFKYCVDFLQEYGFIAVKKDHYFSMALFCGLNNACGFYSEEYDSNDNIIIDTEC